MLPHLASFIFFLILFYVHGCFESMHMCCAVCVLGVPEGPKMVLDSWDLQLEVVMCVGNAGPLKEQQVCLTTDLSVPVFVCLLGFCFFFLFHIDPGDVKSSGLHSKHFPHCAISPALESLFLLLGEESNVICKAVGTKDSENG